MIASAPDSAAQTWTGATNATWQTTTNWNLNPPGTTETAIFNASSTQNLGITLNGAVTVRGLRVVDPAGPLSIGSSTLSLGTGGIDMSAATQNLTVTSGVTILSGDQSWTPAAGRLLTIASVPVRNNGANNNNVGGLLRVATTGSTIISNTARTVIADGGGNPFVTYGLEDWAATDATGLVIPAAYTTDAFTGNANIVTPNTYAINGATPTSVRFDNATGDVTVNNTNTSTLRGILMTSTATAVTINGGFVRPNRVSTAGVSFSIVQNSTLGDLTIGSTIGTASSNTPVSIVKSGAGRFVLTGNYSGNGRIFINEGTVQLGNGTTAGTLSGTANDIITQAGATFAVNRSNAVTISNAITGGGQFTQMGSGSTTLSGSNTFTGPVNADGGALVFATAANLGAGAAINFNSGTLTYASGNTTDVSGRTITFNAGGGAIDTAGNNVTFANAVGNGGAGGLTKAGAGRLTLAAGGTYAGTTAVSGGELRVNGPLSSPTITVASAATFSGTGALAGSLTLDSGAVLAPGNAAVGSLTLGSLTTSGGSSMIWEFNSTPANDLVVVSTSDGLTINGGTFSFFSEGTSSPFGTVGTYNLIQYTGSVFGTGVGSLAVGNPAAGKSYTFGESGGYVTLTIATSGLVAQWNVDASGDWTTPSNWTPSEPNGAGDTASFGSVITSARTVTLGADRTIGNMVFSSTNSYTIAPAASQVLTVGDGSGSKTIQVESGSHAITAGVALASNATADILSGQQLRLSGTVSGAGGLTKTGSGTLILSASNIYTGDTTVSGGTVEFAAGAISSGVVTLGGGGVTYAPGNTEDLSVKTLNLVTGGGTIDTGTNDVTFANSIGNFGTGGLTKTGSGTLTLQGLNTYAGATTLSAGVVAVSADAALGDPNAGGGITFSGGTLRAAAGFSSTRPMTASAASTIDVPAEADALVLTGVATGGGRLTKTGSGTLQLDGANTAFTGGVTLAGGTVTLGGGVANAFQAIGTGTITFQNGSVLNLNGYANTPGSTSYGNLTNAVVVPAGQSGTMNLPGRCTISSAVTGSGTLGVNVQFVRDDFTGNWSAFAGTVVVGCTGTNTYGEFRLGGAQTTFGNARVNLLAGTSMYQTFNPPSGTGTETVQPIGELSGDGTLAANPVTGRFTNWTIGGLGTSSTFAGRITDSGTAGAAKLTKTGSGTLTLTGTGSTFTGPTTVNGGTLYVNSPNGEVGGLATTGSITVNNGGTLRSSANALFGWNANQGRDITVNTGGTLTADDGADVHVGRVTLNGGVLASSGSSVDWGSWIFDGPATILAVTETSTASAVNVRIQNGGSIDVAATKTLNFVGTITDSGSAGASNLLKTGSGTLALNGASTYTGPTSVSAGTLFANTSLTTTAITTAAGAAIGGSGTVGSVTMSAGSLVAPGNGIGTFTVAESLAFTGSSGYLWQLTNATGTAGATTGWDLLTVTGTLDIAATSADPFQINLWTLSTGSTVVSGSAANFSATQSYTWKIASAAGGISGFAADKFVINTSATNGTGGFANTFTGGTFSLAQSGNDLNLVFTGAAPAVITIDVPSGTQTQTQAGYPTLSGSIPVVKTGDGTLVLDQANALSGSTTVQGGVLQLANSSALAASRLVVVAGGTGQLGSYVSTSVAGLDLAAGNGLVDLTNGALTILGGMTAPELVAELLEGRGDGSWTGTSGITSSTAAAESAASIPRAVGWLDNGDGSLTVAYAAPGDTNIDWSIDILDASNFLAGGKFDTGSPATWIEGDFSYDGIVDILDAADFFSTGLYDAGNYNTAPGAAGVAAVPEPAAVAWFGVGIVGAVAAMRRRIRG